MQFSYNDLRKQCFIRVGGEEGLQLLDLESGGHVYELCLCMCVYIYVHIYIYIYIYIYREREREGECLSLWRIIMYLFPKLYICYVIRVAISEARNGHGTVFTILGCSSSGMKLVLGDGKVNRRGMDEL